MKSKGKNSLPINKSKALFIIGCFLICSLLPNLLSLLEVNYSLELQITIDIVISLVLVFSFRNLIIKSYKDLKKEPLKSLLIVIVGACILIVGQTLINYLVGSLLDTTIENNRLLDTIFYNNKAIFVTMILFTAPILETFIIPVAFHELLAKNKNTYLFISSLAYGLYFVVFSIKEINQLVFIITYMFSGFILNYIYHKKKNFLIIISIKWLLALVLLKAYM